MVNADKDMVRQILYELNVKKVHLKMIPKHLTQEQKANQKNISSDIME
jgi:hypothetical protein